jgi:hypothetical protein
MKTQEASIIQRLIITFAILLLKLIVQLPKLSYGDS